MCGVKMCVVPRCMVGRSDDLGCVPACKLKFLLEAAVMKTSVVMVSPDGRTQHGSL